MRKNISYDVVEAHGVDVDADAPLDSWLLTPERVSESTWWNIDFNVTLDEMTRAALADSGGGGHIGFAISTDMAQMVSLSRKTTVGMTTTQG